MAGLAQESGVSAAAPDRGIYTCEPDFGSQSGAVQRPHPPFPLGPSTGWTIVLNTLNALPTGPLATPAPARDPRRAKVPDWTQWTVALIVVVVLLAGAFPVCSADA